MNLTSGKMAIPDSFHTPDDMREEILSIGTTLAKTDSAVYAETVVTLAKKMSSEERKRLLRSLRSPLDAVGILKDSPLWPEVEAAIERNRQNDTGE